MVVHILPERPTIVYVQKLSTSTDTCLENIVTSFLDSLKFEGVSL
jgi:hypothetical protein